MKCLLGMKRKTPAPSEKVSVASFNDHELEKMGDQASVSDHEPKTETMGDRPVVSVAPMMDWTTHHFRQLMRVHHVTLLYTVVTLLLH